jgi:asparagine synthetase B (glutamine-hydrolysing)
MTRSLGPIPAARNVSKFPSDINYLCPGWTGPAWLGACATSPTEYVPAPASILPSIRKLPAGHWLTFTDGRLKIEPYWTVSYSSDPSIGAPEAVDRLRAVLDLVVRQQLVSDVPLGVFLSGGIDSSTVAAFAAPHVSGRLKTFLIGFEDPSFDESAHARHVARVLGTDHHEELLDARGALDLIERLPDLLDEPLSDASLIPTFLLSRFARRSVTVALSGDGGDELFAGCPTYQARRLARAVELVPRWIRSGVVQRALDRLPVSLGNLSVDFKLERFFEGMATPTSSVTASGSAPSRRRATGALHARSARAHGGPAILRGVPRDPRARPVGAGTRAHALSRPQGLPRRGGPDEDRPRQHGLFPRGSGAAP